MKKIIYILFGWIISHVALAQDQQLSWINPPNIQIPAQVFRGNSDKSFDAKVLFTVDTSGKLTNIRLQSSSGNQVVDQAIIRAMHQAFMTPYSENGVVIAKKMALPVKIMSEDKTTAVEEPSQDSN